MDADVADDGSFLPPCSAGPALSDDVVVASVVVSPAFGSSVVCAASVAAVTSSCSVCLRVYVCVCVCVN